MGTELRKTKPSVIVNRANVRNRAEQKQSNRLRVSAVRKEKKREKEIY